MRLVVCRIKEQPVMTVEKMGNRDRSTKSGGKLVLVIDRLANQHLGGNAVDQLGLGGIGRCKAPAIENPVAYKVRGGTVILIAARLHRIVHRTSALVFGRLAAGQRSELTDAFGRNHIEDGTVVANLADGRHR